MKIVQRLELNKTPDGNACVFPRGRFAAVNGSILNSFISEQGLDFHEAVNGRVAVTVYGLRLRVVAHAFAEDEKTYSTNYLVAREGRFARAFVFCRRKGMWLVDKLLTLEIRLRGKSLEASYDIPRYSPALLIHNIFASRRVVRAAQPQGV